MAPVLRVPVAASFFAFEFLSLNRQPAPLRGQLYGSILRRGAFLVLLLLMLGGCAGVKVSALETRDYISLRRGDVLSTGQLSSSVGTALQVVGIGQDECKAAAAVCLRTLGESKALGDEQRLSVLAELWLQEALRLDRSAQTDAQTDAMLDAYLESARHAYAYLFMTERTVGQRALDDRQTQVRDYYNFSVQKALTGLFARYQGNPPQAGEGQGNFVLHSGRWQIQGTVGDVRLAGGRDLPEALIPAASLSFKGLRNQYRRDGLGAELVAMTDRRVVRKDSAELAWSETPFPAVTAVASFPGATLDEVLSTQRVHIVGYDPFRQDSITMAGREIPLAASFTSGYGLWLARSGFASQSLLTLVGKGEVLEKPHVYLMQPYDPNRRIIIMLHGLASSPEAWINVANEVLGDEALRQNYQIWQVYYPTNAPLAFNNKAIRTALEQTLEHFDPSGTAQASRDMVVIGHSMGGVLSRLMLSSSGDRLWDALLERYPLQGRRLERVQKEVGPYVRFEPLPDVSRAIFVAAPHRGTPFAENRISRWAAGLVKLPASVLGRITDVAQLLIVPGSANAEVLTRPLNSIDNLSSNDPFVRLSADLPISPAVRYHSIIGNYTPALSLLDSSDGVVPYSSAHLAAAESEIVIPFGHSVQETPEAIMEIRRILHVHLQESDGDRFAGPVP
ncbi:esterase/lipase family protein [Stutzerimonas kunmingensis]|uniref:GPI inositol-deacylase n=1 Tax=Stutzerimonas kunmingensis TaxID=1211807 RepID=A0A9X1SM87_9GAMM|nr:alpha/beta fold hydrolase [Stutzerimonas kunmingensis]MCD1606400.1 GPI inositol-deacylase [Stutzerimonas kunmingensis]PNG01280.1 alpha/beta hydrolase [Stutzerimonas kunmingensis]